MRHDVVGVARQWDEQALEAAARHEHDVRVRCRVLALRQLALGRTVAQTAGPFMLGPSQLLAQGPRARCRRCALLRAEGEASV